MIAELSDGLDMSRVHFLGSVDHDTFIDCLSISTAHVYLTYPFILSWSLLDAMACECLVIGSDTAPVREVIAHAHTGLLTDFFGHQGLAALLLDVLAEPERFVHVRREARRTVLRDFDRHRTCRPAWLRLIEQALASRDRLHAASTPAPRLVDG